jgi:hypothetical protein
MASGTIFFMLSILKSSKIKAPELPVQLKSLEAQASVYVLLAAFCSSAAFSFSSFLASFLAPLCSAAPTTAAVLNSLPITSSSKILIISISSQSVHQGRADKEYLYFKEFIDIQ